ncbi:MAG: diaminopimelate decarboxylase [Dehalococcoidia bacterium SM23_28_2]|nr:MAG: diaminopimelate decarboxylase [Dehalococcoidia bacterium SM23_28_2]
MLPLTAAVNDEGHLAIGGCDTLELAREFGTPLYVFDEETLRHKCREFRSEFRRRHADSGVSYAAKAYLGRALAALLAEEEMDLEVVSGGELAIARSVDFPPQRVYFHGNNKSEEELREALDYGIGHVVVDNPYELELLNQVATSMGKRQPILLRLSPNVDPHTHRHTTTGVLDSKFGFPIVTGQAEAAIKQALSLPAVELVGLHFHLGSPIPHMEPYQEAVQVVIDFAAQMAERHGFRLSELSPGGGFAIQYLEDIPAPAPAEYAAAIASALVGACRAHSLPLPRLVIEPGRAIGGQACVALYKVGARKEIPGVRTYVAVDGGMGDNIRPALYSARYSALVANKVGEEERERVAIAGKFCESGDVLVRDADLPRLEAGDILAMAAAGAYCLPMGSNYNAFLRPAIVMVRDGAARLIRRRETYEDLMRCEVWPSP